MLSRSQIESEINALLIKFKRSVKNCLNDFNFEEMTLSNGIPGLLLLLNEFNVTYQTKQYQNDIRFLIEYLFQKLSKYGLITQSLYSGAAGIAVALSEISQQTDEYNNLLNSLDEYIVYCTNERIDNFDWKTVTPPNYDIIEGLSGILVYLITFKSEGNKVLINRIINFLTELISNDNNGIIKMYISIGNQMSEPEEHIYPDGCLNLGLAHGLAGIISVLAYANRKGYDFARLDKIGDALEIYEQFQLNDSLVWKDGLTKDEYLSGHIKVKPNFIRDAWCYGRPGIALTYLYYGMASKKQYFIEKSENILINSLDCLLCVDSTMICHGISGILATAIHFKRLLSTNQLDSYIDDLILRLSINPQNNIMNDGFLEGKIGVILTLMKINRRSSTRWESVLLLFNDI
ncbi:lanthionine synthetase C family protein [Leuconostoc gasicomitatum]|uniref:lanthionine synthetase C family protein n=1 Tax=Leuconostoc gasicomitatum TaxID=115778 RepID=UPI0007E10F42|nr:lanthionine synthetase C family protein [Leuconostoc gasicomitatum]CUW08450.1 Lanthionine biosynthesis cyclase LanC [Leuconostoc gasicomitatum]